MKRLAHLTLVFTIFFAILFLGPPFLGQPFGLYDLMKNGDVLDLLTPLVLIPLYWLLFQIQPNVLNVHLHQNHQIHQQLYCQLIQLFLFLLLHQLLKKVDLRLRYQFQYHHLFYWNSSDRYLLGRIW